MLTKKQLLQSVTSIGVAISAIATPLTMAQANHSIPSDEQHNTFVSQSAPTNKTSIRRYGRSIALGTKIDTVSGADEVALAEFLVANDVKFYGAYWCPHCQKQKSLFGAVAAAKLPYVECAKDGENSQRELCKTKGIKLFPTWVVKGKSYEGSKDLKEIAELVGYQGSKNFKYKK
jgi:thiol-disulfide isomerase/thioredoxin